MNLKHCEKIFNKTTKKLNEAVILIENTDGSFSYNKGVNRTIDSPMNLASITKLFVTTCVLQLVDAKKLSLDDKISKYLDEKYTNGLHVYKSKDYSDSLTISDLLYQVSGLPDYYFEKSKEGISFETLMWEHDKFIPFDEMIEVSKGMNPAFEPRKAGRAYYADINFDLLGKILENIYNIELYEVFEKQIFEPLGLLHTYIISEKNNTAPKAYKDGKAHTITNFLRACPASGGGVTTAREFMIFMKAFFGGKLFPADMLTEISAHNRLQLIYGSVQYSGGHMYIHAGYLFRKQHTFRGHSGATGSFAYYCEETGLFFVGDLNNGKTYIPVNMMLRMEYSLR